MAAVGIWGLFTFMRGGVMEGSISGSLVIGQVLIGIQGLMGLIMFADGFRPADLGPHPLWSRRLRDHAVCLVLCAGAPSEAGTLLLQPRRACSLPGLRSAESRPAAGDLRLTRES